MAQVKDYERVGRLIYALQRVCGGAEGLLSLQDSEHAAPATVAQGKALAGRCDAIVARCVRDAAAVTDEEIAALLADAGELAEEATRQCGPGWMWRKG